MEQAKDRLIVLEKIKKFEKEKNFNEDVEDDQPPKVIRPKDVDYTNRKLSSKFLTWLANKIGSAYFESMIKKNKFIIKEVHGLENVKQVKGGAIITCNHFNLRDNYAVYKALIPTFKKKQMLYKVIKEGNYTGFKGPVRLMMRHANTLPLSSSYETMKCFNKGVEKLLNRGEKILIYPEQAMWWNYRKPRPLKPGAFKLASKFGVPVIPTFITMKDSSVLDDDGFFVQEYYIHFLPAIYPNNEIPKSESAEIMSKQNYDLWVDVYEKFYQTKLEY